MKTLGVRAANGQETNFATFAYRHERGGANFFGIFSKQEFALCVADLAAALDLQCALGTAADEAAAPEHVGRSEERARALRYDAVVLDTLPGMERARALYREYGFRETEAYYDNPIPGVTYLRCDLR